MRYLGQATLRRASDEDQEHWEDPVAYFLHMGMPAKYVLGPKFDPADHLYLFTHANEEVAAVVVTEDGKAYKIRGARDGGLFEELVTQTAARPVSVAFDWASALLLYLVRGQLWGAKGEEVDESNFLTYLHAAAIERDTAEAQRLARAQAVIATADGGVAGKNARREPIADDVKMFVWQRDGGRCVGCGTNADLEFDHIIPLSMGGSNTARNLQLLCGPCNRLKGGNLV